jgi:hypothetical protein
VVATLIVLALAVLVALLHGASAARVWAVQPDVVRRAVPAPGYGDLLAASWQWPALPHEGVGAVAAGRLRALGTLCLADLRVLGVALALMGLARSVMLRPALALSLSTAAMVAFLAGVLPGTSGAGERWPVAAVAAWVLVGLGLGWIAQWRAVKGPAAVAVLAGLMPVLNVPGLVLGSSAGSAAPATTEDLVRPQSAPRAFVASAPAADRVLHHLLSRTDSVRIPLRRHVIEEASRHYEIVAMGAAGDRLELLGARLHPESSSSGTRVSVLQRLDPCLQLIGDWADVSSVAATGRIGLWMATGSDVQAYVTAPAPLRLRLGATEGSPEPRLDAITWDATDAQQRQALARDLGRDGVPLEVRPPGVRHVSRVAVRTSTGEAALLALATGTLPSAVVARLSRRGERAEPAEAAFACAGPGGIRLPHGAGGGIDTPIPLDHRDAFADGWHEVERIGRDLFRWTASREANLLVRLDVPADVEITVEAAPSAPPPEAQSIGLRVGGSALGDRLMPAGTRPYGWHVPASMWRAGVTQVTLTTSTLSQPPPESGDRRWLGLRVSRVAARVVR